MWQETCKIERCCQNIAERNNSVAGLMIMN